MLIEIWVLSSGENYSHFLSFFSFPIIFLALNNWNKLEKLLGFSIFLFIYTINIQNFSLNLMSNTIFLIILYLGISILKKLGIINHYYLHQEEEKSYLISEKEIEKETKKLTNIINENQKLLPSLSPHQKERLSVILKKYFYKLEKIITKQFCLIIKHHNYKLLLFQKQGELIIEKIENNIKLSDIDYWKKLLNDEFQIKIKPFQYQLISLPDSQDIFALLISPILNQNVNNILENFTYDFYNFSIFQKLKEVEKKINLLQKERETYNFISNLTLESTQEESIFHLFKKITEFTRYLSESDFSLLFIKENESWRTICESPDSPPRALKQEIIAKISQIKTITNNINFSTQALSEGKEIGIFTIPSPTNPAFLILIFQKEKFQFSSISHIENIIKNTAFLLEKYKFIKDYENKIFLLKFISSLHKLLAKQYFPKEVIEELLERIRNFFQLPKIQFFILPSYSFGNKFFASQEIIDFFTKKGDSTFLNKIEEKKLSFFLIYFRNNPEAIFIFPQTAIEQKLNLLPSLKLLISSLTQIIKIEQLLEEVIKLKNLNERFLTQINSGLLIISPQRKVIKFNHIIEKILNIQLQENEFLPEIPFWSEEFQKLENQYFNLKNFPQKEIEIELKHQNRFYQLSFQIVKIEDDQYYMYLVKDITAKKKSEEHLRTMEKLASLGQLSAGIAHEIRNPLGGIELFITLLKNKFSNDEKTIAILDKIISGIEDIKNIIENLLLYAKPEATQIGKINPCKFLEEINLFFKLKLAKYKIKTDILCDENSKTKNIKVPFISIKQIVINLIMNSIEALKEIKKDEKKITILSTLDEKDWKIEIKDNGPGIKEEILKKIFDPFFTTKASGTGLGLSIVQRLAKEMKAELQVESSINQGTSITIIIPLS